MVTTSYLGLGVHSDEVLVIPDRFQKLVEIPSEHTCNRHIVRNFVQDLQFFHADAVDLVQHVDARDVFPVAFNDVDKIVFSSITAQVDVCIEEPVLLRDGSDSVIIHLSLGDAMDN